MNLLILTSFVILILGIGADEHNIRRKDLEDSNVSKQSADDDDGDKIGSFLEHAREWLPVMVKYQQEMKQRERKSIFPFGLNPLLINSAVKKDQKDEPKHTSSELKKVVIRKAERYHEKPGNGIVNYLSNFFGFSRENENIEVDSLNRRRREPFYDVVNEFDIIGDDPVEKPAENQEKPEGVDENQVNVAARRRREDEEETAEAEGAAENAEESAKNTAENAEETAKNTADKAEETAKNTVENTEKTAGETADKAKEFGENVSEKGKEELDAARKAAEEAFNSANGIGRVAEMILAVLLINWLFV